LSQIKKYILKLQSKATTSLKRKKFFWKGCHGWL
jgi:hypothetical protein